MLPRIIPWSRKSNPLGHLFTKFIFDRREQVVKPSETFPSALHQQRKPKTGANKNRKPNCDSQQAGGDGHKEGKNEVVSKPI